MQFWIYRRITFSFVRTAAVILACLCAAQLTHSKSLLVYGDSLSAGYGINPKDGWVELLQAELGTDHTLINASVSGETSSGGLARIEVTLDELEPDLVLLELGANDGLRGGSVDLLKENLRGMITQIRNRDIDLVLIGISVPPTYGPRYIDSFRAVYKDLAAEFEVPLFDFYREEFFLKDNYIQADGLHPTAAAQPEVRDLVLDFLRAEKLVD